MKIAFWLVRFIIVGGILASALFGAGARRWVSTIVNSALPL